MPEDHLFELPDVPPDLRLENDRPPTWNEQMAHAQLLLSWQKAQGLAETHPPRNPEPFRM